MSKLGLYEGGIREPFIAWCPELIPTNRVDETTVLSTLDMFPTLAEIAAAKIPADTIPEGQNLSAAFFGKHVARTAPLFWEYGRNTNSFAFARGHNRSPNLAMREGNWKFLIQSDGSNAQLYNLANDRVEKNNVLESHPAEAARMKAALLSWRKSLP